MIATLFGGAVDRTDTSEYKDTVLIGELLAERGYLVKNGGYRGLMEAVSKGVASKNGRVHGYTCATFPSTVGNGYLTETVVCPDIYDRLRGLIAETNLFVVQRGGIGTLAELFLSLDIIRKMKKDKPRVILVGLFWKDVIGEMRSKDLVTERDEQMLEYASDFQAFTGIL